MNVHDLLSNTTNVFLRKLEAGQVEEIVAQFRSWQRAGQGGRLRDSLRELFGVHAARSGRESLPLDLAESIDFYEFLAATIRKIRQQIEKMRSDHEQYQRVISLAPSRRERQRLILEYAARLGASKRDLRKDEQAFRRWFGHDAVVERYHRQYAQLEQTIVRLLEGAGRTGKALLQAAVSNDSLDAVWYQLEVGSIFLELAGEEVNDLVRIGLCEYVMRVVSVYHPSHRAALLDENIVMIISRLAMDPVQNVWLQSSAIEAVIQLHLQNAPELLRSRFVHPGQQDDFFVRRRAIELLVSLDLQESDLQELRSELLPLAARDRSPFVRQGAAVMMFRGVNPTLASQELSRLALSDEQPSVRACALMEGVQAVPYRELRSWFTSLLVHVLDREKDPFVLRTALHVSTLWCKRSLLAMDDRAVLLDKIERPLLRSIRHLRETGQPNSVRRWAANAVEQIWGTFDRRAAMILEILNERFDSLEFGRRRRLPRAVMKQLFEVTPKADRELLLGRALAVVAQEDFGFDVEPGRFWWTITKGSKPRFRFWRMLHELLRPSPEKRQAFSHTTGRVSESNLRVPSGILAEVSPTKVPGEPLLQPDEQSWRPYLPLVDDVLSALNQWIWVRPVRFFTAQGVTTLVPPRWWPQRILRWVQLSLQFHRYAELRNWHEGQSMPPDTYVRALRHLGFDVTFQAYVDVDANPIANDQSIVRFFQPIDSEERVKSRDHDAAEESPSTSASDEPVPVEVESPTSPSVSEPSTPLIVGGLAVGLMPLLDGAQWEMWLRRYATYFTSVYENTVPQLLIFAFVVFALFFFRQWYLTRQIRRARRTIRLSVGGWGTRGKSGTERLKAALFSALGFGLISKSSGCEAMFLYGPPYGKLRELGLFRPYDKATIWEHQAVMRLAGKLDASVFLWECMGLNPSYVRILQHEWAQDDLSTVTNTYPDHEDIQGPAGINVAEAISRFIPTNSRLLTTEHQMRPVLTRQARRVGTSVREVGWLDVGLLTPDILKRFPYEEHPDNIALTMRMAEELGIPADFALKEMADRIVPDIGVLKTYPEAIVRTRRLVFSNGMSANERHGCLGNWTRLGFDRHDPTTEPGVWISTVVNNRADRIARSRVFASILVHDLSADRHFLIGGNLDDLQTYIWQEFGKLVSGMSLWSTSGNGLGEDAPSVFEKAAMRFRIPTDEQALLQGFRIMVTGLAESTTEVDTEDQLEKLLPHWQDPDRVAGLLRGVGIEENLITELQQHLTERLERFSEYREFALRLRNSNSRDRAVLDEDFRQLLARWFERKLVVVEDYHATGEQIVDLICTQTPPGFRNRIMGLQNIKGTGLDFVYRWLAWQKCSDACDLLESQQEEEFRIGLRLLNEFREYGQLCEGRVRATLDEVRSSPFSQQERVRAQLDMIRSQFDATMHQLAHRLDRSHQSSRRFQFLYRWLDEIADPTDAVRRRRWADRIYRDLSNQRISIERTVVELRRLNQRQKTGWLAALSRSVGKASSKES